MKKNIFATYLRVSTKKQGATQLGLEHQRLMCKQFIEGKHGVLANEFIDIESGTHRDRKGLWSAIEFCNKEKCPLVIATLSRLARDVEFCFKIVNTGIEIHFCDMPQMNTLLLGVFASVAQYERELTSERTRNALAAKKARGEALGAASEKYKLTYNLKSKTERKEINMKRGSTKNARHLESRDVVTFLKVLKKTFPSACESENAATWDWSQINTKGDNKINIISYMKDFKDMDESGKLFRKWDFSNEEKLLQKKLSAFIQHTRESLTYKQREADLAAKFINN